MLSSNDTARIQASHNDTGATLDCTSVRCSGFRPKNMLPTLLHVHHRRPRNLTDDRIQTECAVKHDCNTGLICYQQFWRSPIVTTANAWSRMIRGAYFCHSPSAAAAATASEQNVTDVLLVQLLPGAKVAAAG
jgi:hypothetical protein